MMAECPKCRGTLRVPATDWNRGVYGYSKEADDVPCTNCGGQTMSLRPTGEVPIDPSTGLGCMHEYKGRDAGRCYTVYVCQKCGDRYGIDSGD